MSKNKRSDVSKGVKKFSAADGMRSQRGSCCRKQPPGPTPKTVKQTDPPPPPPIKLPDIKQPNRPKIIWPIAPDGFIPNSVVRSQAPFPPRSGSTSTLTNTAGKQEEIKDFVAKSFRYIDGLVKK